MTTNPTTVKESFPDYEKWSQSTIVNTPSSTQLWASAKFIGRECSDYNISFLKCKMEKGEHPGLCIKEGDLVRSCTKNIVNSLNTICPTQFSEHEKCLNENDYRIEGCLVTERNLVDCWNASKK